MPRYSCPVYTTVTRRNGTVQHLDSNTIRVRTDAVVKDPNLADYKYLIEHGLQATTHLLGTRFVRKAPIWRCVGHLIDYPWTAPYDANDVVLRVIEGTYPGDFPTNSLGITFTHADNLAKRSFVSKATAAQTTFQGGVFLGELRETISLLRHPAQLLRKDLGSYLRTVKKRIGRVLGKTRKERILYLNKKVSDHWLEYSLGWKPLLSDIQSAGQLLSKVAFGNKSKGYRKFIAGFGKDNDATTATSFILGGNPNVIGSTHQTSEVSVKYYGLMDIRCPNQVTWRSVGLTPDNFFPTIWELIPYSFVVDYFTNIGDMIAAASFTRTGIRWMAKGTRLSLVNHYMVLRAESSFVTHLGGSYPVFSCYARPSNATWANETVERSRFSGSLVPQLEFTLPGHASQWLNIAGLLTASTATRKALTALI
jgi:hypothetical protein